MHKMMVFRMMLTVITLLSFLFDVNGKDSTLRTWYLTDDCKNDREITSPIVYKVELPGRSYSSGILTVSRNNWYLNNLTCWIILRPPPHCGIIISISITDFHYSRCLTNLTIENSSSVESFTYCGQIDDQDELNSHYTNGDMNIYFRSRSGEYYEFDKGFTLTYTSYSKFPCASYEFKCPVGCISKSLTCDGHNHCGDRSDQRQCSTNDDEPKRISSSTTDVKLAVGIISGFLILGMLGALLWKLLNCEKRPEVSPSGRRANATNSSPPVVEFYRHNFPDESQSVTITESNEPVTPPPSYDPPPLYETLKFGRSNPCYE